jgi:Divergent InlB B-repeat domain
VKRIKPTRRGRWLGLAGVLSAALLALLLTPVLASASTEHQFVEEFGSAAQPTFGEASGMAVVQSSGDLLVIDVENKTVSRWKPNGEPDNFSALTSTNVIDGHAGDADETPNHEILGLYSGSTEVQVAVDNSATGKAKGDIYVTDSSHGIIDVFASTGQYKGQLTGFGESCGVAVDSNGAVYVGDAFEGAVDKFVPAANPVVNGDKTNEWGAGETGVAEPCSIATGIAGSFGYIFVLDWGSSSVSKVNSTSGEFKYKVTTTGSGTLAVDPNSGHVFTTYSPEHKIQEYDASGASSSTLVATIAPGGLTEGLAVAKKSPGKIYTSLFENPKVQVYSRRHGTMHVILEGAGEGEVSSVGGFSGHFEGSPPIECSNIVGEVKTECETTLAEEPALEELGELIGLHASPDTESELVAWTVEPAGDVVTYCEAVEPEPFCNAGNVHFTGDDVTVKATFNLKPAPQPLTLTKSGEGSGTFECKVLPSGTKAPCVSGATFPEGSEVEVTGVPGTGSVFAEFTSGAGCEGASCVVTMSGPKSVNAKFDLELVELSVTHTGEGSTKCEDVTAGGGLAACAEPAFYPYGHTIKVEAEAETEWTIESLVGDHSAAGHCNPETGVCSFTLTETSGVAATFVPAKRIASLEEYVHGEVPETTELASSCNGDVDLGTFEVEEPTQYYPGECELTATATGELNTLTAADKTGVETGFLTQKLNAEPHNYTLVHPLETMATDLDSLGGLGSGLFKPLTSDVTLLTYGKPVNEDHVKLQFRQLIDQQESLHTGVYAKEITLTLYQTTP